MIGYDYGTHALFIFRRLFCSLAGRRPAIFAAAAGPRGHLRPKIASARMSSEGSVGIKAKRALRFSRWSAWGFAGAGRGLGWMELPFSRHGPPSAKTLRPIRCHFASLCGRGPAVLAAILGDRRVFRRPFCSEIHHLALAAGDESGKICDRFSFEPIARSMIRI